MLSRGWRHHPWARVSQLVLGLVVGLMSISHLRNGAPWHSAIAVLQVETAASGASGEEIGDNKHCQVARTGALTTSRPRLAKWERLVTDGRIISGFRYKADRFLKQTLSNFDKNVTSTLGDKGERVCASEREVLEVELQKNLHSIFLAQRSSIEEVLFQRLRKDLLKRMRGKRRELNVQEKLKMMHGAMNEYDSQVKELQPSFVDDSERDRAEKRLSELQWGIGDTPEAKEMKQRWKMEQLRRMPMRQSSGISVSLSPGIRLMLRPEGLGNFQLYSRRQVGPPHNPNEVAIGVLNDGKVADVYHRKPKPPFIKFQPSVGVDLSFG